jgi:hypothetical protein
MLSGYGERIMTGACSRSHARAQKHNWFQRGQKNDLQPVRAGGREAYFILVLNATKAASSFLISTDSSPRD